MQWDLLQTPEMIARLVLQVVLFAMSAYFSMSETGLFSLRESDLREVELRNPGQARRLRNLLDQPRQLIVSILCGNELINIAATINLAGIMLVLLGSPEQAALANLLVMAPLLLVLGEITPKTLAVTKPRTMATRVIEPLMTPWVRIVAPLRAVVRVVADRVTDLLIGEDRTPENILGTDELRTLLQDVEKQGLLAAPERRMITNLMQASEVTVREIMVPRPQVAFIDGDLPVPEILARFRELRHRRVPVYRGRRDVIIGMLRDYKVAKLVQSTPVDQITLADLLSKPMFVPETQTVSELAERFKTGDHHAAIVINEFGGVEGLTSMDDVFGYLTQGRAIYLSAHGEIEEPEPGAMRCDGLTPVRTLIKRTALPMPELPGVFTVGGLILAMRNALPAAGDTVSANGLTFRVEAMDGLKVDRVLIAPDGHPVFDAPPAKPVDALPPDPAADDTGAGDGVPTDAATAEAAEHDMEKDASHV